MFTTSQVWWELYSVLIQMQEGWKKKWVSAILGNPTETEPTTVLRRLFPVKKSPLPFPQTTFASSFKNSVQHSDSFTSSI